VIAGKKVDLCVTTDAVVEGIHFTREGFSPRDIGHKALAVNLSDLASMGASPAWFVCAVAHPVDYPPAELGQLSRGMAALAREAGIELVGGNFTRASELSITLTAAGEVPHGKALTRAGARPGDLLFVTGTLGEARLGLALLGPRADAGPQAAAVAATALRRVRPPPRREPMVPSPALLLVGGTERREALRRQLRPTPRLRVGQLARRYAHAAIDLSDGLAQDLAHLCRASGVGARVELNRLPAGPAVVQSFPDAVKRGTFALAGGEDYELLLAVPPSAVPSLRRACRRAEAELTHIGEVVAGSGIVVLSPGGARLSLPKGFDHFPSDRAG